MKETCQGIAASLTLPAVYSNPDSWQNEISMQIAWEAIRWWELRRISFNLILLAVGSASLVLLYVTLPEIAIVSLPGFAGILLYGIVANLCYTLGWLTEWLWSGGDTSSTRNHRPKIFKLGLAFSMVLTAMPAYLAVLALISHRIYR